MKVCANMFSNFSKVTKKYLEWHHCSPEPFSIKIVATFSPTFEKFMHLNFHWMFEGIFWSCCRFVARFRLVSSQVIFLMPERLTHWSGCIFEWTVDFSMSGDSRFLILNWISIMEDTFKVAIISQVSKHQLGNAVPTGIFHSHSLQPPGISTVKNVFKIRSKVSV